MQWKIRASPRRLPPRVKRSLPSRPCKESHGLPLPPNCRRWWLKRPGSFSNRVWPTPGAVNTEVKIATAYEWRKSSAIHMQVLPADGNTRYAIGWNGAIIPVESVGAVIDLHNDFPADGHGLGQFHTGWGIQRLQQSFRKSPAAGQSGVAASPGGDGAGVGHMEGWLQGGRQDEQTGPLLRHGARMAGWGLRAGDFGAPTRY